MARSQRDGLVGRGHGAEPLVDVDGLAEETQRFFIRVAPERLIARALQMGNGARCFFGLAPVMRQQRVILCESASVDAFVPLGHCAVQLPPLREQQPVVGDVLCQ